MRETKVSFENFDMGGTNLFLLGGGGDFQNYKGESTY